MHDMLDRSTKLREISNTVRTSTERVSYILHETWSIKKLSGRWVTQRGKNAFGRHFSISSWRFYENKSVFVCRCVAMAETCIHHYTLGSKQKSMQWVEAGSPAPKKAKPEDWFIQLSSNTNETRRKKNRPDLQKKEIIFPHPAHKRASTIA